MKPRSISAIAAPVEPVFPPGATRSGQPGHWQTADGKGAFLGILMLESRFPRPSGDVGHPDTFGVPTRRMVVKGATAPKVVRDAAALAGSGLLDAFANAARQLERDGAAAITTSCGFLVLFQRELQQAVRVPVVTSSLLLLPRLLQLERQVGVLTISAQDLGREHLLAAGVPGDRLRDVVVQGVDPAGEFASAILSDRAEMDLQQARDDVVAAAAALKTRAPQVRSLVLECTNMPPYAAHIEAVTGLRTCSLRDALPRMGTISATIPNE